MDLKIACIKYTRGLLKSSQLPIIATQALEDGYDSTSLVLLASEYEPIMADVGPLLEAAMHEVDIQSNDSVINYSGPLSTQSPEFSEQVLKALGQNDELLVLQRFPYTAGAGEGWHLINRIAEWQELLVSGKAKTAYTVILERELPIRGIANEQLKSEAIRLFDRLGDLMIGIVTEGESYLPVYSFDWETRASRPRDAEKDLVKTKKKIHQFFEKQQGKKIVAGRDLGIWNEDIAHIVGYVPDTDGVVRPGAY